MFEELQRLYMDLEGRPARFRSPFKSIFFCGGEIGQNGRPISLRDYLYRTREMKVRGRIILAEAANQLYRDTGYSDLISFEEDIARIASLVMVIAESPGSLAELGAFSVNDTIRPSLRVISQDEYAEAESFIRFGPVEKVIAEAEENVAFFPWRVNGSHVVVRRSVDAHYAHIKQFIARHIDGVPDSQQFHCDHEVKKFLVVYWSLYLAYAASINVLLAAVRRIYPDLELGDLRDILYCLRAVGWIEKRQYSNKNYYFAVGDADPITYKLKAKTDRDIVIRRRKVREEFAAQENLPKFIKGFVAERRASNR